MILYHYTSTYHLPTILKEGLARGDVPVTPQKGFNAVWFTTMNDAKPGEHGLSGSAVDKTSVRITVELDRRDPLLIKWGTFARKLKPIWRRALESSGGDTHKTWYFYKGILIPEMFIDVCTRPPWSMAEQWESIQ
jgi:hypothetical protein